MEEDLSGSCELAWVSCPHIIHFLPEVIMTTDTEEGGWIRAFSRVIRGCGERVYLLPRPPPQFLTGPQIFPDNFYRRFTLTDFQFRLFSTPSRGFMGGQ